MISAKRIKGLSVNRVGEGKGFRKSPLSHNMWPQGRSLADQSVHCQNTIRGCQRRSNLERNTTEEEIGGRKACIAGDLSIDGTKMTIWLVAASGAAPSDRLGLDFLFSIRTTSVPAHENIFNVLVF
jgi:hypothetical protein